MSSSASPPSTNSVVTTLGRPACVASEAVMMPAPLQSTRADHVQDVWPVRSKGNSPPPCTRSSSPHSASRGDSSLPPHDGTLLPSTERVVDASGRLRRHEFRVDDHDVDVHHTAG